MKRICLQSSTLQLTELSSDQEKDNIVWMTVILNGAFRIEGIRAGYEKDGSFFQNWSNSRLRFLDVPFLHRREKENDIMPLLLQDIIGEAVYQYFWQNNSRMKNLLKGKIKNVNLESFKPEKWGGKKLTIPVEFIQIRGFNCSRKNGEVFATVQVGHHLVIHHVYLYSHERGFYLEDDAIEDKKLSSVIEKLITSNKALQGRVLYQSQNGTSDFSRENFIDKTEECIVESIPPPISLC